MMRPYRLRQRPLEFIDQRATGKRLVSVESDLADVMGGVGGFMPQGQGGAGASGPFASILKFMTTGTP